MTTLRFIVEEHRGKSWLRVEQLPGSLVAGPVRFNLGAHQVFKFGRDKIDVRTLKEKIANGVSEWRSLRDEAVEAGTILFSTLMADTEVRRRYRAALKEVEEARAQGNSAAVLHLWLGFEHSDFRALPWELMFDPERKLFLSTSRYISIARVPEPFSPMFSEQQALPWWPPLRLLVVMATPALAAWPDSHIKTEFTIIDTLAFSRFLEHLQEDYGPELIDYELLSGTEATPERLQRELEHSYRELEHPYDVLYFVGHSYRTRSGEIFFVMEDGSRLRRGKQLSAATLGQWLITSRVRSVILSSCDSFAGACALSQLARLEAVLGMQMKMPIITAAAFDESLIEALVAWQPIERCIISGRQQVQDVLRERSFDDAAWDVTDRPDWAIPVLFTRRPEQLDGFCSIPAGRYQLGLNEAELYRLGKQFGFPEGMPDYVRRWVRPPAPAELPAFQISRWLVTNHQYRYFLENSPNSSLPPGFERRDKKVRLNGLNPSAPVVNIAMAEAEAYCRWAGGRLPRGDEWEVAARGLEGRIFPWGDEFDCQRCLCRTENHPHQGPESVMAHANSASPFKVEDMCGNVFEWAWSQTDNEMHPCAIGGSWASPPILTLPSLRSPRDPNNRYSDVGFRCAL